MGVVADQRRGDAVMVQELFAVPGILGGNQVHLLQDPQGPEGDVLQIADGRGDDVESANFYIQV